MLLSGANGFFVSLILGFTYPFQSDKSTCRALGKKCWPASQCKPPSISTTMNPSQTPRRSKKRRHSPSVCRARRQQDRAVAQEERAEEGWQAYRKEGGMVSGIRVSCLQGAMSAPASEVSLGAALPGPRSSVCMYVILCVCVCLCDLYLWVCVNTGCCQEEDFLSSSSSHSESCSL